MLLKELWIPALAEMTFFYKGNDIIRCCIHSIFSFLKINNITFRNPKFKF